MASPVVAPIHEMPFELRIDNETHVVRIDLRGDITGSDLLEAIIHARDLAGEARPQLWDARAALMAKLDPDLLDSLHELVKLRVEHGFDVGRRRALITASENFASIAELIADEFKDLGVEIRVFADEPSATEWLSGP